jgi:hypothetical protein
MYARICSCAAAAGYSLQDAFALERRIEIGTAPCSRYFAGLSFPQKDTYLHTCFCVEKIPNVACLRKSKRGQPYDVKFVFLLNNYLLFLKSIYKAILYLHLTNLSRKSISEQFFIMKKIFK